MFKHHLSVLEGHWRMLDMIRKHTVEGSGDHASIMAFLERAHTAIRQTKDFTRHFVPPPGLSEQVPIGSSSASMYPGYSPADILYGEPARELGEQWAQERLQSGHSLFLDPDGPTYELGQGKGGRKAKKGLAQIRAEQEALGEPSALPRPPRSNEKEPPTHGTAENGTADAAAASNGPPAESADGSHPYFVVDSNPMPVQLPNMAPPVLAEKSKKRKRKHDEQPKDSQATIQNEPTVEKREDDETTESKNKRTKKDKKRQKAEMAVEAIPPEEEATAPPRAKKDKKAKKSNGTGAEEAADPSLPTPEARQPVEAPSEEPKKSKKKKTKKINTDGDEGTGATGATDADGKVEKKDKEKKKKKEKSSA